MTRPVTRPAGVGRRPTRAGRSPAPTDAAGRARRDGERGLAVAAAALCAYAGIVLALRAIASALGP